MNVLRISLGSLGSNGVLSGKVRPDSFDDPGPLPSFQYGKVEFDHLIQEAPVISMRSYSDGSVVIGAPSRVECDTDDILF